MPQGYEQRIKQKIQASNTGKKYTWILEKYYCRNQSKLSPQEYSFKCYFFLMEATEMPPNMEILSKLRCPHSEIQ